MDILRKLSLIFVFVVAYTHTTQAQCSGPIINTFPYTEGFESAMSWTSGGTNSDWSWGTPNCSIINSAGEGTKSWVVGGLNGTGYNSSEQSWLRSPCFDFSSLSNPWIQFKIFWECERQYDGMVLQSSADNGASWQNVGAYGDPVNCLNQNWFNHGNITWLTSASPKHGWSGRTGATSGNCAGGQGSLTWVTASHCLEDLLGEAQVQFRFLFGSGTTCNSFDGVAIDDIFIGEAPSLQPEIVYSCLNENTITVSSNTTGCPSAAVWNFGDGSANVVSTVGATIQHAYSTSGTYPISLTVGGICYPNATTEIHVSILEISSLIIQPSCFGYSNGSIQFELTPSDVVNANYNWNNFPSAGNSILSDLGSGNYDVQITADSACSLSANFNLNEPSEIIVDLVALDADCGVLNGSIQSNVSGGTAPYSYTWSNSAFSSDLINLASGQYDLILEDSNGCSVFSEIVVGSNPLPSMTWNANDASCYGLSDASIFCEVSGFSNELTWTWSPNVSSTNSANNLSMGVYQVTAALNQDCFSSATIEIFNPLQLEVDIMESAEEFYTGEMAVVNASSFGGVGNYSYSWNISLDQDASAAWLLDSTAWIFVTVTDDNGCAAEDSLLVIGVERENLSTEIYIPNSFSPNDDGLNDVFYPVVNGGKIEQLSIFNRWGNLIFNGFGEEAKWYGNVNEGEYYSEDGSFTFQVQYSDAAGGRKVIKGHVILLR